MNKHPSTAAGVGVIEMSGDIVMKVGFVAEYVPPSALELIARQKKR